jgi:hypothetical protein
VKYISDKYSKLLHLSSNQSDLYHDMISLKLSTQASVLNIVFHATPNNYISVMSWGSEETGVPEENNQSAASH